MTAFLSRARLHKVLPAVRHQRPPIKLTFASAYHSPISADGIGNVNIRFRRYRFFRRAQRRRKMPAAVHCGNFLPAVRMARYNDSQNARHVFLQPRQIQSQPFSSS